MPELWTVMTKMLTMAENIYAQLPLEGLYELLCSSSKELLLAIDSHDMHNIKVKAKQLELLCTAIEEIKKARSTHDLGSVSNPS